MLNGMRRCALVAMVATITGCAGLRADGNQNLHSQMVDLSKTGAYIAINIPPGDPIATRANPDCKLNPCIDTGRGIHIGEGYVLTAAHVIERMQPGDLAHLSIAGFNGSARLVWKPESYERGKGDVALLQMLPMLYQSLEDVGAENGIPVCEDHEKGGDNAVVIGKNLVYPTKIVDDYDGHKVSALFEKGVSGSGVVDIDKMCVRGVISAQSNGWIPGSEPQIWSVDTSPDRTLITPINLGEVKQMLRR